MLVLSAVTLFAATHVQTIVLVSVVEEVKPCFGLEVSYVENGYGYNTSKNSVSIESHNVAENVRAEFSIWQTMSRYMGEVEIKVSVSELYWNGYHTDGLKISAQTLDICGRHGLVEYSDKSISIHLTYEGKAIMDSVVAEFSVEYNGDSRLPQETYVSYVQMMVESK